MARSFTIRRSEPHITEVIRPGCCPNSPDTPWAPYLARLECYNTRVVGHRHPQTVTAWCYRLPGIAVHHHQVRQGLAPFYLCVEDSSRLYHVKIEVGGRQVRRKQQCPTSTEVVVQTCCYCREGWSHWCHSRCSTHIQSCFEGL